jgi:hypothetical protein
VATTAAGQTYTFGPVLATARPVVTEFALGLPTPNPASGSVKLDFALPNSAKVTLTVHDVQGRVIARLADGTFEAGIHQVTWDARPRAALGLYFAHYQTPKREFTRRILLVR